jgi:hypothetical protein
MGRLPPARLVALAIALGAPRGVAAQTWNGDAALALARRAIARRQHAASDTALHDYKAQAHGFLFFLGQLGEGLAAPPRLVKADQLELEVYWKAPDLSKQRIVGWRDQAELPTDIAYHTDHLGIVQNNFGDAIRLGGGDEVRDVPHPLAPGGPALYDYALGDTTVIELPQRVVRVVALQVRPKRFDQAGIVGTVYLDAESADLVRLSFSFTAAAYLDRELEDVSIVLDNALWEDRFWLPYHQELEIRRRARWLDMPIRGIIRGRWEVDGYQLNVGLARSWFVGPEITAVPKAERDSFPWTEPLATAIQGAAEPVRQGDLDKVRAEIAEIAGRHAISSLGTRLPGARTVSDVVHVNRVEGLALGGGVVWRARSDARELRAFASYGLADRGAKGRITGVVKPGHGTLQGEVYRVVRDVGDVPVIAPILNSLSAQEFGDDYGHYYLATGARLAYSQGFGAHGTWRVSLAREAIGSLAVHAEPASGAYAPNPAFGGPDQSVVELYLRRPSAGLSAPRDIAATLGLEGGRLDGGATYARLAAFGHLQLPVGATRALIRVQGGLGSAGLPPHRAFVLGGRGTLLGDDFRAWGGRRMALLGVEWRVPAPFPSVAAGPGIRTPRSFLVAPFAEAGWADEPVAGTPWVATPGARVTLGIAVELLGLLRFEWGMDTQVRSGRFAFDFVRDFWGIL